MPTQVLSRADVDDAATVAIVESIVEQRRRLIRAGRKPRFIDLDPTFCAFIDVVPGRQFLGLIVVEGEPGDLEVRA